VGLGEAQTEVLLDRVRDGDGKAVQELLTRHRDRLRQMVRVRMDPRLRARLDPSDIVQEALADASRKLPDYLRQRSCPFYPWLRQLAWQQLVRLHRRHVLAERRSVTREVRCDMTLSDPSTRLLAAQVAGGTSVGGRMVRKELCQRVREALAQLPPLEREAVVLRHLELLSLTEMAAVLGTTEEAARSRYRRGVERLHTLLSEGSEAPR